MVNTTAFLKLSSLAIALTVKAQSAIADSWIATSPTVVSPSFARSASALGAAQKKNNRR